ncbi:MAG: hypothetical protein ACHP84_05775 [Caulobacterales bacterium]
MNKLDMRGWVTIGLFGLTACIFAMIYSKPDLTKDQVFVLLAQAIVITGLVGGVIGFLFGASKKEPAEPPLPPDAPGGPQT